MYFLLIMEAKSCIKRFHHNPRNLPQDFHIFPWRRQDIKKKWGGGGGGGAKKKKKGGQKANKHLVTKETRSIGACNAGLAG